MKNKYFLILKWVDFLVILFAIFANSRLGMSDTLTSIILIIGLAFIILISIIEKSITKGGK